MPSQRKTKTAPSRSSATQPARSESVYFDRILASLKCSKPKRHAPDFSVRKDRHGWRIYDGQTAIAAFGPPDAIYLDAWAFSPFEPPVMANAEEPEAVFDLHTVHNTFVNLPFLSCRELVEGLDDPQSAVRCTWVKRAGRDLHYRIEAAFAEGQRAQYDVRIQYDPAWCRYRYYVDADVWKLTRRGMEPINMMMAGALQSTPDKRRWTHSVWEGPRGELKRLVHSNALFSVTDFKDAHWRTRNTPYPRAWVAYGAHESFNPAMLIYDTNAPIALATCSQLFDEHLIWQDGGADDLEEGFFRFFMRTELVNLPAGLARELLGKAEDPPRPAHWRNAGVALAFEMDKPSSFETAVDVWAPESCPILVLPKDGDSITWATDAAHTGRRSLRFEGRVFHGRTEIFPGGAVCSVKPHSRYRLSAWIKTKDVERFARLELYTYEYLYPNVIDFAQSRKIGGTQDWTQVTVDLDTAEEAYIMPRLLLYGRGIAWFDDVTLERIS